MCRVKREKIPPYDRDLTAITRVHRRDQPHLDSLIGVPGTHDESELTSGCLSVTLDIE